MATVQEAVRRLKVESTESGTDAVTGKVKNLDKAYAGLAVTSQTTEKAALSLDRQFLNLQRRFDENFRKQQDYEKVQRQVNAAIAQNPALLERGNKVIAQAAIHYGQASVSARAFMSVTQGVSGQLIALSAGAGPVGVFLSALGPWGLAAAAGLGAATSAIGGLSNASDKFVQKMVQIREAQDTLRLSGSQVQSISKGGAAVGFSFESSVEAFGKFTIAMDEVRRGEGRLFEIVNRINPQLALQLAATNDNAKAFDIYADAVDKAGNSTNALLRAGLGRGGPQAGSLVEQLRGRGGLDAASADDARNGRQLTDDYIDRIKNLRIEIDKTRAATSNMFGQVITENQLTASLEAAQLMERIARAVTSISQTDISGVWTAITTFINSIPSAGSRAGGSRAMGVNDNYPDEGDRRRQAGAYTEEGVARGRSTRVTPVAVPQLSAEAQFNIDAARVAALGSAATASERLALKQLELNAAVERGAINQETYNRALAGARQDVQISALSSRISLLGDLASTSDIVLAKQLEINRANQQGANITREESAAIKEKTRLQAEYAKLGGPNGRLQFERDQVGRGDVEATVAGRLRSEGLPIDLNSTTAAAIRMNEQLKISKDLALDFASGFARDLRAGVGLMEALTNAASRLQDRLIDMALNKAISGLVGGGLNFGSLFQSAGGNYGASAATTGSFGGSGFAIGGVHAGGVAGVSSTFNRYVHPAYFDDAKRYHSGGIVGDEVPVIAKKGEEIGWPAQMAAKYGSKGETKVIINNYGADVQQRQNENGDLELTVRAVARDEMASSRTNGINRSKYGQSPRMVARV